MRTDLKRIRLNAEAESLQTDIDADIPRSCRPARRNDKPTTPLAF
jgi:hypothetical protein